MGTSLVLLLDGTDVGGLGKVKGGGGGNRFPESDGGGGGRGKSNPPGSEGGGGGGNDGNVGGGGKVPADVLVLGCPPPNFAYNYFFAFENPSLFPTIYYLCISGADVSTFCPAPPPPPNFCSNSFLAFEKPYLLPVN